MNQWLLPPTNRLIPVAAAAKTIPTVPPTAPAGPTATPVAVPVFPAILQWKGGLLFYQLLSLLKKTLKANDSQNALLWTAPVILLHCNGVSSVACKETYLPHLLILCKIHLEKSEIEICMQEICNTSTVYILYLNIINQLLPLPMLSRQEGPW